MARIAPSIFITLALTLSCSKAFAAKSSTISDLRKNLRSQERVLKKINHRIISLEKSLGSKNKDYIQILESKRTIENQIYKNAEKIEKYLVVVKEEKEKVKNLLGSVVANSLSDEETSADLLTKKMMAKALTQKILKLKAIEQVLELKQKKYKEITDSFKGLEENERTLLTVIENLENQKKEYASQYVEVEKKRTDLSAEISSLKSKIVYNKSKKKISSNKTLVNLRFSSPIEDYVAVEYGKKGINFKFRDRQPIKNTINGKVSFVGSLSNYGNVIMVEHGNQTRSIFLGQLKSKVKKGQSVNAGDILGYTLVNKKSRELAKLYFEVRKKNIAQNTSLLMDEAFVAKNNLNNVNI
ncbi:hypothetical protein BIY24_12850 [Halobacteriovorax marinus]|uniref:murein hydrolase activator EnvC family protein n=1 Tax=Halobacteriovorax marinus TaxID=97084 RepID=UPI000BC2C560|nr:M23 family metallopeptidase [Halobacteriovorax marinus]ATH08803.1 hypothetical protein BIY24_12850 [Halobacteriovorax marinus]